MLATQKGASEFVEVGLKFLLQDGLKEKLQVERLLSDQCQSQPKNKNKNKVQIHDTLFTLMMKNIEDDEFYAMTEEEISYYNFTNDILKIPETIKVDRENLQIVLEEPVIKV